MKTYLLRSVGCILLSGFCYCQSGGESTQAVSPATTDTLQTQTEQMQDSVTQAPIPPADGLAPPPQDTLKQEVKKENKQEDPAKYEGNFVVSFFSRGSGIDSKTFSGFNAFIESYNQKNKTSVKYNIQRWGKEGEKDFCFEPDNNPHFESFITEAKAFLAESKLVRVKEHAACRE